MADAMNEVNGMLNQAYEMANQNHAPLDQILRQDLDTTDLESISNPEEFVQGNVIFRALMHYARHALPLRVAVLHPNFCARFAAQDGGMDLITNNPSHKQTKENQAYSYLYTSKSREDFEVVLIPFHVRQPDAWIGGEHYMIGIYDRRNGAGNERLHFYNSKPPSQGPAIDPNHSTVLRHVLNTLLPNRSCNGRIGVPRGRYNLQEDCFSCGVFICYYAKQYLTYGRVPYADDLNIQNERALIREVMKEQYNQQQHQEHEKTRYPNFITYSKAHSIDFSIMNNKGSSKQLKKDLVARRSATVISKKYSDKQCNLCFKQVKKHGQHVDNFHHDHPFKCLYSGCHEKNVLARMVSHLVEKHKDSNAKNSAQKELIRIAFDKTPPKAGTSNSASPIETRQARAIKNNGSTVQNSSIADGNPSIHYPSLLLNENRDSTAELHQQQTTPHVRRTMPNSQTVAESRESLGTRNGELPQINDVILETNNSSRNAEIKNFIRQKNIAEIKKVAQQYISHTYEDAIISEMIKKECFQNPKHGEAYTYICNQYEKGHCIFGQFCPCFHANKWTYGFETAFEKLKYIRLKEEKNYDDFPLISKTPFKLSRPDGVPELNEEELNDARYWINYANAQKNASRNTVAPSTDTSSKTGDSNERKKSTNGESLAGGESTRTEVVDRPAQQVDQYISRTTANRSDDRQRQETHASTNDRRESVHNVPRHERSDKQDETVGETRRMEVSDGRGRTAQINNDRLRITTIDDNQLRQNRNGGAGSRNDRKERARYSPKSERSNKPYETSRRKYSDERYKSQDEITDEKLVYDSATEEEIKEAQKRGVPCPTYAASNNCRYRFHCYKIHSYRRTSGLVQEIIRHREEKKRQMRY